MKQKLSRVEAIQVISRARHAVCEQSRLQELMDDYGANTVFDALLEAYAGVTNGFLSQVCEAILGQKVDVVGEPEVRFPCPCCNRQTLTELFDAAEGTGFDVCDYCGWEDDGTQNDEAISSVNRGSMADYRSRIRDESKYPL